MQLSETFFSLLPKTIELSPSKIFEVFSEKDSDKKAYFSGKRVLLMFYKPEFGESFKEITEEYAKQKHLGKVRCIGNIKNEIELMKIFSIYFNFIFPESFVNKEIQPQEIKTPKIKKIKETVKKEKKVDLDKICKKPQERDEVELVRAYRSTESRKLKNKIFNTILFERGVNGKTWDKIIRNYISFNKHKISNFKDRSEEDFYQEIVIALHKQVETWFNLEKNICFSTYAWYVINCAFNRVLQHLLTQKRKITSSNSVELDNDEFSWDESISKEKSLLPTVSFEEEHEKKDLCNYIKGLFEIKSVEAPKGLKDELEVIIKEKSTMQNSLYSVAKKYNYEIEKIFKLEKEIRENLKNSMFCDIILSMQYENKTDEEIASQYNRSKGHVVKMKKYLSDQVKIKMRNQITI